MNQPKNMNPRYRWSYQSVYDLTRLGQFKEGAPKIEITLGLPSVIPQSPTVPDSSFLSLNRKEINA